VNRAQRLASRALFQFRELHPGAAAGAAAAPADPHRRKPARYLQRDRYAWLPAVFGAARQPAVAARGQTRAYREAWAAAGYPGHWQAYLQVPIYVGETRAAALAEAEKGMMQFSSYRADLRRGPMSYEEVLREKAVAGDPPMVIDRLAQLREEAVLDGVSAEINPGSMLSHERVMNSLRLYCQKVMPHFK
jgi:hypothetical protein